MNFPPELVEKRAPITARAIVSEAVGLRLRPGDGLDLSIEVAVALITREIAQPGWHELAVRGRAADPWAWDDLVRMADRILPEPCARCRAPVWPYMHPAGEPGAYICYMCRSCQP